MEDSAVMEGLSEAYESLTTKKAQLKQYNEQVAEECERHPGFKAASEELESAKGKMKIIKAEALERTGLHSDINNLKTEIKIEQDSIDGYMAHLLGSGQVKAGQEMNIGGRNVTPKIRVVFTKQMSLL